MKKLTNEELAYIAGIIDGEGSIQIFKRKTTLKGGINPQYGLWLKIDNTDPRLIFWLKDRIGGSSSFRKAKGKKRTCYSLRVAAIQTQEILQKVLPFLVIKKEQALISFEFRDTFNIKYYGRKPIPETVLKLRESYYKKLKDMHHIERYVNEVF